MKIKHPVPNTQIWVVAYTVENREVFELRTNNPNEKVLEDVVLWHDEAQLGTAAVNLMDADLDLIQLCFPDIQNHLDMINCGKNVEACFEDLFAYTTLFLSTSGLLAPLAAIIETYYLDYKKGKELSIQELKTQFFLCRHEQKRMEILAKEFFNQKKTGTDGLLAEYLARSDKDKSRYRELAFGKATIARVSYADRRTFPYDRFSEKENSREENVLWTHAVTVQFGNLYDISNYMIYQYLKSNLELRSCKFCGNYFAVKRTSKAEYCDRLIEGSEKTCKQVGAARLYNQRQMEEPAVKAYTKAYKTHNARIRYGLMTRWEFQDWAIKAREKRDLCLAGKLSLEEYEAWLESDKM